jgi:hypothetical protein
LAKISLRVHLIIVFFPDFKEELEVLLRESIQKLFRLLLLLFIAYHLYGDLVSFHCIFLHLLAWGDFLLHHTVVIIIVGVLWIENWGGQEIGGQRRACTQRWHLLLNQSQAMEQKRGGRKDVCT